MSDHPPPADSHARRLTQRTAAREAAFLLPYLRPGLTVLDCGCGPGTITAGLAKLVAPGHVVGVDLHADRLAVARAAAAELGLANLRYETGDIHALPFPAATFDAALVHAVVEHLPDPVAALTEVRRVLKPGGVIGVRSPEHGMALIAPADPLLERWHALFERMRAEHGLHPVPGRALRGLLRAAGYADVIGAASVETQGTLEETRSHAANIIAVLMDPTAPYFASEWVRRGWATPTQVEEIAAAWRAWGEHPDAFFASTWCEAVGWVA